MRVLNKLVDWLLYRNMCKCQSPKYEVVEGKLGCSICRKFIKRGFWKLIN